MLQCLAPCLVLKKLLSSAFWGCPVLIPRVGQITPRLWQPQKWHFSVHDWALRDLILKFGKASQSHSWRKEGHFLLPCFSSTGKFQQIRAWSGGTALPTGAEVSFFWVLKGKLDFKKQTAGGRVCQADAAAWANVQRCRKQGEGEAGKWVGTRWG